MNRSQAIAEHLKTVPQTYIKTMTAAFNGTASSNRTIKAQCLQCVGYERVAIRDCTATLCPLWKRRPYQQKPAALRGGCKPDESEPITTTTEG